MNCNRLDILICIFRKRIVGVLSVKLKNSHEKSLDLNFKTVSKITPIFPLKMQSEQLKTPQEYQQLLEQQPTLALPILSLTLPLSSETLRLYTQILFLIQNYEPVTFSSSLVLLLSRLNVPFTHSDPLIKSMLLFYTHAYPILLRFLAKFPRDHKPWLWFCSFKDQAVEFLYHSNQGIQIHAIKFLQICCILQSPHDLLQQDKNYPSLDDIPLHHPFLKTQELRSQGIFFFPGCIHPF